MTVSFLFATQVPVQLNEDSEGRLVLHSHMMKNTDHYEAFLKNPNALALFVGPHAYVSASVYTQACFCIHLELYDGTC